MTQQRQTRRVDGDGYEMYAGSGWETLPLHHSTSKTISNGRERLDGKRPIDRNWSTKEYDSTAVIARCIDENRNMGIRPGRGQVIIDVDPRHGGNESLLNLCLDHGLDTDRYPRVRTGADGDHFYATVPAATDIVLTLAAYPGLEFRSQGHQCVAAGSVHPNTGHHYAWDTKHPPLSQAPELPASLVEALRRWVRPEHEAAESGIYSADQIRARLAVLDPIDHREYHDWIRVGMAVKQAGGDDAYEVWEEWNERDPQYAGVEEENRAHWDSFTDRADGITYRTLDHLVREAGYASVLACEDFADEPIDTNLPKESRIDGFKLFPKGHKRKGQIVNTDQDNIRTALRRLEARVGYDEFSDRVIIEGLSGFGPYLDDAAMDRLWLKVDETFAFRPSLQFFETVVRDAARRSSFHPVKDYLAKAQATWDGTRRLDRWLIDYAGAQDTPYIRAVSALPSS
jgi:hypothetical protein